MKILPTLGLGFLLLVSTSWAFAEDVCPCSFRGTDKAVNALKSRGKNLMLVDCLEEPKLFQIDIIEQSKVDGVILAVDANEGSLQCQTVRIAGRKHGRVEHHRVTEKQARQCMADLRGLVGKFEDRLGKEVIGTCKPN